MDRWLNGHRVLVLTSLLEGLVTWFAADERLDCILFDED
jgi:hypothetical protein